MRKTILCCVTAALALASASALPSAGLTAGRARRGKVAMAPLEGVSRGAAPAPGFEVAYPAYLSGHDIVYLSPPTQGWEGLPIGNGDLGAMIWTTSSGLKLQINKTDTWDQPNEESGMLLRSCGQLTIDLGVPCHDWLYLDTFEDRLSLAHARTDLTSQTPFMKLTARAYAQVSRNVLMVHCRAEGLGDLAKRGSLVRIGLDRWGSRGFGWWYGGIKSGGKHGLGSAVAGAARGAITLLERLNGLDFAVACRVIGARASAAVTGARRAELSLSPKPVHDFTLLVAVVTSNESPDPLKAAEGLLDATVRQGLAGVEDEHDRWWKEFWSRSFVHIGDDYLENLYYLHLYLMGSSSRGKYPVVFDGGLWTWNHDVRQWNYPHHWNMQQAYWSLEAANHAELMEPYLNTYLRLAPKAEEYAKSRGFPGALLWNEMHDYSGRMLNWDRPSFVHNWTPATQIGETLWQHFLFTGDQTFLRDRAYPFMKKAAEFYLQYLKRDPATSRWYIYPASPYECESGNDFRNTITDLANIRASFRNCIRAAETLGVDADKRARWSDVLDHLSDYPVVDLPGDGEALAVAQDKDGKSSVQLAGHDYAFCSTMAPVFPAGVLGLNDRGDRLFDDAVRRVRRHPDFMNAISPASVVAARLGMGDEAARRLSLTVRQLQHFPQGLFYNIDHWYYLSRYAGKVADSNIFSQRDYITDSASKYLRVRVDGSERRIDMPTQPFVQCGLEPLGILAEATNEMLLQSYDGQIRVFPATPVSWPAAFTLRATGGFLVTAEKEAGRADPEYVRLESLFGKECRLVNPWPGESVVVQRDGAKVVVSSSPAGVLSFATTKGETYFVRPAARAGGPPAAIRTFTAAPATGPRHYHEAVLGKDRDF